VGFHIGVSSDYTLTGIINKVNDLPQYILLLPLYNYCCYNSVGNLSFSSLVAFGHDRTTPASAPHACGFVNGSGILLTCFNSAICFK
jgi:hypothetical protein